MIYEIIFTNTKLPNKIIKVEALNSELAFKMANFELSRLKLTKKGYKPVMIRSFSEDSG
jgi:hypothetical protein